MRLKIFKDKLSLLQKEIFIPEIGKIKVYKRKSNKRIIIRVRPYMVKVSIPYYANFKDAEKFILQKLPWIKENLKNFEKILLPLNHQIQTLIGLLIIYIRKEIDKPNIIYNSGILNIYLPEKYDIKTINLQVEQILKEKAKTYLIKRLDELAKKYNFFYDTVHISVAKTRWGSCSSKNRICLNYRLIFLPEHLCNYVILHELVHTEFKNHGKDFWSKLNYLVTDAKAMDKELKHYSKIYANVLQ